MKRRYRPHIEAAALKSWLFWCSWCIISFMAHADGASTGGIHYHHRLVTEMASNNVKACEMARNESLMWRKAERKLGRSAARPVRPAIYIKSNVKWQK